MPYTASAKKDMLESIEPDEVSLHDGDPGEDGANEVEGGGYARHAIAWNVPAAGVMDDSSNGIDIQVPGGTTVKAIGYWKEGVLKVSELIAEEDQETFAKDGTFELTDAKLDLNLPD
jgi:hypothetical protein